MRTVARGSNEGDGDRFREASDVFGPSMSLLAAESVVVVRWRKQSGDGECSSSAKAARGLLVMPVVVDAADDVAMSSLRLSKLS